MPRSLFKHKLASELFNEDYPPGTAVLIKDTLQTAVTSAPAFTQSDGTAVVHLDGIGLRPLEDIEPARCNGPMDWDVMGDMDARKPTVG